MPVTLHEIHHGGGLEILLQYFAIQKVLHADRCHRFPLLLGAEGPVQDFVRFIFDEDHVPFLDFPKSYACHFFRI